MKKIIANGIIKLCLVFVAFYALPCYAIMELGIDYSYSKQKYDNILQSETQSNTYGANLAWYLWEYTGFEFSYSYDKDTTNEGASFSVEGGGYMLVGIQTIIKAESWGIGLKQVFAPRRFWLVPSLSLGYSDQSIDHSREVVYILQSTSAQINIPEVRRSTQSAMFASLGLGLKLTNTIELKFALRSIFPVFEFSEIKNSLKYTVGLTWVF